MCLITKIENFCRVCESGPHYIGIIMEILPTDCRLCYYKLFRQAFCVVHCMSKIVSFCRGLCLCFDTKNICSGVAVY